MRIEIDEGSLSSLIENFKEKGYTFISKSLYIGAEDITHFGGNEERLLDVEITLRFHVPDKYLKIKEAKLVREGGAENA
jgi:hypothetical protein